jgi:hypothetical protein
MPILQVREQISRFPFRGGKKDLSEDLSLTQLEQLASEVETQGFSASSINVPSQTIFKV